MSNAAMRSLVLEGKNPSEPARGPHQCSVATDRTAPPKAATAFRWARTTVARSPRRVERDSLGDAHGRAVGRDARPLSPTVDLSSAGSAVGPLAHGVARPVASSPPAPRPPR